MLDTLGAGNMAGMAHGDKDGGFGEGMHEHVQQAGKGGQGPSHAKRKGHQPHVFDGRIAEHALDVPLALQGQHRHHEGQQTESHHEHPGHGGHVRAVQRTIHQHLETHHSVQSHVEQQAGKHRRHGGGTFGMGIRQPEMHRHQPHLGAITHQQKNEGNAHHPGIQRSGMLVEYPPAQAGFRVRQYLLGGKIHQHRAKQGQGNAHATENEIFPGSLDGFRRAVQAHQQHRRQGRAFHRHPEDAQVVTGQSQQHGEQKHLEHGMVEAHALACQAPLLADILHVRTGKYGRGQTDEGREHDQVHIEGIDLESRHGQAAASMNQHRQPQGGQKLQGAEKHIQPAAHHQAGGQG